MKFIVKRTALLVASALILSTNIFAAGASISISANSSVIVPNGSAVISAAISTSVNTTVESCTLIAASARLGGGQTTPALTQTKTTITLPDGSLKSAATSYGSAGMESIQFAPVQLNNDQKMTIRATTNLSKEITSPDTISVFIDCFVNNEYVRSNQLSLTVAQSQPASPTPTATITNTPTSPAATISSPEQTQQTGFFKNLIEAIVNFWMRIFGG